MRLGTTEIILIVVLALVLFGGGKLAGVGKALGKSIKDFKNGKRLGGASADAQSYNRCAESASLFSARLPDLTFFFELF